MQALTRNALVALVLVLVPLEASAVELYGDGCWGVSCPPVYVVDPPVVVMQPTVVHVVTQPVVVEETVVETVTVEEHVLGAPKLRPPVDVEVDAGVGMWIVPKLKEKVNLSYDVRLSLLVKSVIMTLSLNIVPEVEWDAGTIDGTSCVRKGNLFLIGMGFGYRWNKKGHFHPEVGVKLDGLALDRKDGKTVYAFGIGGTAGLMADFPVAYGSIMGGIQAEGHYHVWHQNDFFPPRGTFALMALLGYKF